MITPGIRVPAPFADDLILRALAESGGGGRRRRDRGRGPPDDRPRGARRFPEGGATIAALRHLLADGRLDRDERVVVFNCGSGLKYR